MKKIAAALLMLMAFTVSPALAQQKGDWVLARWKGDVFWFPGVIGAVEQNEIVVLYDDGTWEKRPANDVKPYDWRPGSRVECDWKAGGRWYPGKIVAADGANLSILYDDGDKENTRTGRCRSR